MLAERLRQLRKETGLNQVELARRLGVSVATVNRLESVSQNTTLRTLNKICRALDCRPGELFEGPLKLPRRRRSR